MKNLFISLIVSLLYIVGSYAQNAANYSFNTSNLAVLEDMNVGASQLIAVTSPDTVSAITEIGFGFNFMGVIYSQFSVNSNGQLSLGDVLISGSGITDAAANTPLIVPVSGGNSNLMNGQVLYKLKGTSPNRMLIIEWVDLNIPYPIVDNNPPIHEFNTSRIQVYLYESTGLIEFKYGTVRNNSVPTITKSTFISSDNSVKYIAQNMISAIDGSSAGTYLLDQVNTNLLNQRLYSFAPELPPTPTVTVVNNCDGTSILTATNYSGTLLWSTSESTPSIIVSTGGTYTVTQTLNGLISLPGSGIATPYTIPALPASVSILPDNNNVCAGSTVLFTATPVSGGDSPVYQWYKNSLPVETGATYTFIPSNGDIVYVVMNSSLPCVTSNPATSGEVTMIVNPSVFNEGPITGSTTLVKGSTAVPYSIAAIANATSYTWLYTGTGALIHGTGNSITIDFDATATAGQLSVKVVTTCGEGVPATLDILDTNGTKTLTLNSVLLEGLYNMNGTMNQAYNASGPNWPAGVADQITVELHDGTTYPTIVYSAIAVPLNISGSAIVNVPVNLNGFYYITIKHRNSLLTTSATSISFIGNALTYSFGLPTNVFGNNLALSADNYYLIYGGDVNQDGSIDSMDFTNVDNDSKIIMKGYLPSDVNGDGIIDSLDFNLIDNNNKKIIKSKLP